MTNKKPKHIHKYILSKGYTKMWKCALVGCTHIMYNHLREALIGRFSLCNKCGTQFVLTEFDLDIEFPECQSCRLDIKIEPDDMDEILRIGGTEE